MSRKLPVVKLLTYLDVF